MTTPTRSPVTQLLAAVNGGDAGAQDRLWSLIYDELRKLAQHQMASEAPGHTLQPTALVHEAYFRLFGENPILSGLWIAWWVVWRRWLVFFGVGLVFGVVGGVEREV